MNDTADTLRHLAALHTQAAGAAYARGDDATAATHRIFAADLEALAAKAPEIPPVMRG